MSGPAEPTLGAVKRYQQQLEQSKPQAGTLSLGTEQLRRDVQSAAGAAYRARPPPAGRMTSSARPQIPPFLNRRWRMPLSN